MLVFFFFQAEDGIRDGTVTGVQTCALPICITWRVEVPMSVARAVLQGRPTGDLRGGMVAELIAVAKRDLKPGVELDGAGGYTVYGLTERYQVAQEHRLLPFAFAYSGRVKRAVARDQALSWDDVDTERSGFLYELRQEQDRHFG